MRPEELMAPQPHLKTNFLCSKHPTTPMNAICDVHKEFLCDECLLDHKDHKGYVKNYYENDMVSDVKCVEKRLHSMKEQIETMLEKLKDVRQKKILKTDVISQIFADSENLLIQPFCQSVSEDKKMFPLVGKATFAIESVILRSAPNKDYFQQMFDELQVDETKYFPRCFVPCLLYRASLNGFASRDFHRMCDEKGPTVVLVKSTDGYYFGGYNCVSWESNNRKVPGPTNFLFSLNNRSQHKIKPFRKNAAHNYNNIGPAFGTGIDLYICSDCNKNKDSYAEIGHTYESPFVPNSVESRRQLAGARNFQVEDYEVFSIAFVERK